MKPSVLIVEDEMIVAYGLQITLERLGYAVSGIAVSGPEAIARTLQQAPDVLLMDIQLQGEMDGVEAVERIRAQRDQAVVYITANTDETTLRRAKLTEPLGYICKPFEEWELRVALEMALFNHQTRRQLKESQERYRLLFESNPHPMWVFDLQTFAFLSVNEAAIRKYGYSREEFLAMTTKEIRPAEDVAAFVANVAQGRPGVTYAGTWRHRRKDGTLLTVEATAQTIEFGGRPAKLVLANDVTEKLQMEKAFLRAQRLDSLGTLAAGIAHDLNNILAPILMASQILQMQSRSQQDAELIATIHGSAKRGAEVVRQVLTFGRGIEGQRVALQPRHLLKEMVRIMRETFPRNITVQAAVPRELGMVMGDATQLHQVLMNLCVNARDAMPEGGTLRLALQNVDHPVAPANTFGQASAGPHVVLEVSDTGQGIAREIIDKIFDPFFTTKSQGKGTGLGLSTVLGIVKSHGGFVTVDSEPGHGAVFRVHLPAVLNRANPAEAAESALSPDGQGECVLIVDDELSIREVTRKTLERYGYEVLVARHGKEALELLEQHEGEVQTVVTDLMMPVMDGLALVRTLRQSWPHLRIIACTGMAPREQESELRVLGVEAFLEKPYTSERLLNALRGGSPGTLPA